MLSDVFSNHGRHVKSESETGQFVEQPWQDELRNIEKHIHILREAGPSSQKRCEATHHGIANGLRGKRIGEKFDGVNQLVRERVCFIGHDVR